MHVRGTALLCMSALAWTCAQADPVTPPIGAKPDNLAGTMKVTCRNVTTGETVSFEQAAKAFDCRANGLKIHDGDKLKITLSADAVAFAGHRYEGLPACGSWSACEAAAEALGGHLATLVSDGEQDFVYATFNALGPFWIGLTDAKKEGTFKWITGERFHYAHWAPGEPNNQGDEDCVEVYTPGLAAPGFWNDLACGDSLSGVAEID